MSWRIAADTVVVLHAAFVLFVVLGGLLVARWPLIAWLHLPAAAWGVIIEAVGGVCPLTHVENALRERAGVAGYSEGFVAHYLLPILYPAGLTPAVQWALAAIVLALNVAIYGWLLRAGAPRRR